MLNERDGAWAYLGDDHLTWFDCGGCAYVAEQRRLVGVGEGGLRLAGPLPHIDGCLVPLAQVCDAAVREDETCKR